MERLGSWYDDARLTIAVNKNSPLKSIEDLKTNPDVVGNRLVGIESGAGLTKITKEKVIPAYGLDKLDFVESSTPAMLAELSGAIKGCKNIAVSPCGARTGPTTRTRCATWRTRSTPSKDAEHIEMVGRTGFGKEVARRQPRLRAGTEGRSGQGLTLSRHPGVLRGGGPAPGPVKRGYITGLE
jgi:glycine betaine/proline transport system substrate-binding protein